MCAFGVTTTYQPPIGSPIPIQIQRPTTTAASGSNGEDSRLQQELSNVQPRRRGNFWRSPVKLDLLMPPFLQRKPVGPPFEQSHAEVPSKDTDIDSAPRTGLPVETRIASTEVTSDDCITACRNVDGDFFEAGTLNLRESPTWKHYVPCEQDCRTHDVACGELRDAFDGETKSFGEITGLHNAHEYRGEDYQGWEDDFEGDETDRRRPERRTRLPWWSDQCESFSSLSEAEEEPLGTTDPYLSHKLSIPYSRAPRPRYFKPVGEDVEYVAKALPRRPRSPVREILPGKFDLKAAYEEWKNQRQATETRKYLRESKERISQSMKQLPTDQMHGDRLISTVVLQTILEQVTLTLIGTKIGGNVHTFVNIAMAWVLCEKGILNNSSMLTTEESRLCNDLGLCNENEVSDTDTMGDGGLRKTLWGVYRPPFGRNVHTTLHRRLPWPYLSPSHERGHARLYPNVRERITENLPKVNDKEEGSTYVTDLKCFHLKEDLDKSYVAYKRKSHVQPTSPPDDVKEELLAQLLSFI